MFRAPVLNLPIRPCYVASSDRNQMHGFRPDSSNNDLSVHPVRAADFANVASSYPQIERSYREDPASITRHFFLAFFSFTETGPGPCHVRIKVICSD